MKRLLTIALTVLAAGSSHAAIITQNFKIVAGPFAANAPYKSIWADFSVTFDNTSDIQATTLGLTVTNFNQSAIYPLKFAYSAGPDTLSIGTSPEPFLINILDGYIGFFVFNASSDLHDDPFFTDRLFYNSNGSEYSGPRIITQGVSDVPEPSAWAMFVGGFGLVGGAMRRRQRTTVRFA